MRNKIIHCGFEDQAKQSPDRVAIEKETMFVTYSELNMRSNRQAHFLRQFEITKEPVGLLFDNSIAYTSSFLAVLKAGAAPMPMNTAFPLKRLQRMLEESGAQAIGVSKDLEPMLLSLLQTIDITKVKLKWVIIVKENLEFYYHEFNTGILSRVLYPGAARTGEQAPLKSLPTTDPALINEPEDPGYIIYSSGTTGNPKAIVGMHMSLAHFMHWERNEFNIGIGVRVCQISTITFDPCLRDTFIPLNSGGTLCIPSAEERIDIPKLAAWMQKTCIQLLHIVPFIFRLLTTALGNLVKDNHPDSYPPLKSLKYVLIAGEPLYGKDVIAWRKIMGEEAQLANLYGPTETTQSKLFHRIVGPIISPAKMLPVGKPISNAMEMILDKNLRLCGPGEPGEVYIKTPFRSKGYLKNPGLTNKVFIQNPLHNDFEDIVYKTGDLGRYLPDGSVELIGRADNQVKIHGVRIELEEIELCLLGYEKIKHAIVIKKDTDIGQGILVAYYTTDHSLEESEIQSYLSQYLPAVMVPEIFIKMESFPSLVTGKIDKKALPEPDLKKRGSQSYIAPVTTTEKKLVKIFEEVLNMQDIGFGARYFDLGANSLQLLQIITRIRKEFNVIVNLRDFFRLMTIQALAGEVDMRRREIQVPIEPAEKKEYYAISHAQQRMWVLDRLQEEQIAYNINGAYLLVGTLNEIAFKQSFQQVIKRHESLRTIFISVENQPKQRILPYADLKHTAYLELIDLANEPDAERKAYEMLHEETLSYFDLTRGPLLRIKLFKIESARYFFSYNIHHIIGDWWSNGIMIKELLEIYRAGVQGQPYELVPLSIQYKDYAEWESTSTDENRWETQRKYWLSCLAGPLPHLELPLDKPRPKIQGYTGQTIKFEVPTTLTGKLRSLSRQADVSLSMVLLAGYATLLTRYTQQRDILLGTVAANRDRKEIEPLIGFFVNTLVIRIDVSGNPSVWELLDIVKVVTLGAYDHQDYPFEMLVEELVLERDVSRSPLFQVAFGFYPPAGFLLDLPGITMTPLETGITSKYDLTLGIEEMENTLEAQFEYNTGLFLPSTIQRMVQHFIILLEAFVEKTGQKILELPLLTEPEKKQLLEEWHSETTMIPLNKGIHTWIETQTLQYPDTTALVFADEAITYTDLNNRANRLARYLRWLGVDVETPVGLSLTRSIGVITALLAILKAGGAYVPIDPNYPHTRQEFMLKESGIKTLLSQPGQPIGLSPAVKVIQPDDHSHYRLIRQQTAYNLKAPVQGYHLAYIIYTSGSTGRPRGVLINHAGIFNMVQEAYRIFNINRESRLLQFSSLSFDASVNEIFPALCAGACLVSADSQSLLPGPGLISLLTRNRITHITMPPSALAVLPQEPLPYLQTIIVAGEACPANVAVSWSRGRRFINAYGPTETTVWATAMICTLISEPLPIGKPIANTLVYILDDRRNLQPIGIPGELYISNPGLARGYLNQPELSAEKFCPWQPGALFIKTRRDYPGPHKNFLLYKTGDLARWRSDGDIEFLGRIDNQVKIRGFRIETGEIESVLCKHHQVNNAVVEVREDTNGNKRLAAYLVLKPPVEREEIIEQLKKSLQNRLPDYMQPKDYIVLKEFPQTPSGKIDRKALINIAVTINTQVKDYVPPSSFEEKILAEIWAGLLNMEKVGIHDNFFQLGGDSILCIQAAARANEKGLVFTPKQLFTNQTIAKLAPFTSHKGDNCKKMAEQGLVTGPVPLTPIQKWFFDRKLANPHHFNQSVLLEVPANLDPQLLKETTQSILWHHDALRMNFFLQDNQWSQENAGIIDNNILIFKDLSGQPKLKQKRQMEIFNGHLQASLNLKTGPLMRVCRFFLGPQSPSLLLFIVHHLVVDGISWRILIEDFHRVYHQLANGQKPLLPPKTTSVKEWAYKLQEYASTLEFNPGSNHFKTVSEMEIPPLPVDYPLGVDWNYNETIADTKTALSRAETITLLKEVPNIYQTQINDILLTALAITLHEWTGEMKFLIDLESHGREDLFAEIDISRTVGWFTTLYPVVLQLENNHDLGMLIKSIKEQLRLYSSHSSILNMFQYDQDAAAQEKKQNRVLFNYLGQIGQDLPGEFSWKLAKEEYGQNQSPQNTHTHILEINAYITENQLECTWSYNKKVYNPATIERLADRYIHNLNHVIDHCMSPGAGGYTPSDFPGARLDQKQLDRLLTGITSDKSDINQNTIGE